MSAITEELMHRRVSPMLGGMWLSAEALMMLLDHPEMTIERLRVSPPAKQFRSGVLVMRQWMKDAIRMPPDDALQPEEKKFLEHWIEEFEKHAASRVIAIVKRDRPGQA